ncbi:MAG: ABC transporter permease [Paracoccaceae bacterium]
MTASPRRSFLHLRDTVAVLVWRDQKSRYKSTAMGIVWAVAGPLLFLMTFYVLFKVVLPLEIPNYAAHLFIGIVVWTWFQGATSEAVTSIVSNPGLVAQPGFPVAALPFAVTTSHLVTMLLTLPILMAILLSGGSAMGSSLLALPVVTAGLFVFVLAVGYLVAALNVAFRDMQYIVPILLQLGYFTTPIFYDARTLPDTTHLILSFNPMMQFVEAYRAVLMRAEWPYWPGLIVTIAASALLLGATREVFRRASFRFLEEL